ncbi:hypothetical protein CGE01nite_26330 [Cellulomonas gelida]|uniref:HTH marR-type domain-containing protein n=2 Tax=Cellulomonas gelida TaxID=1712 RepID=A0A4Y3KMW2_9CELL|nr:hypothetical protein CGE01nite_26330 [Cellulomonas gelida]
MRVMPEPANPAHYWYGDDPAVADVLEAVRAFRRADAAMRRRTAARMSMNETDMRALQVLIGREAEGLVTSPHHVTRELGISTASTTKLLDRLTDSGHLVRESHPTDRRAVVLRPTPHAHDEVRERLARMHRRMAEVVLAVPEASRADLVTFLRSMAAVVDDEEGTDPLRPANGPQTTR